MRPSLRRSALAGAAATAAEEAGAAATAAEEAGAIVERAGAGSWLL
jgi:hypothetical protein